MNIRIKPRTFAIASVLTVGVGTTMAFQNCSRAAFSQNQDSLASLDVGAQGSVTTFANTTMNTPVTFTVKHAGSFQGVRLTFDTDGAGGDFAVLDANSMQIQFTPDYGFRGRQPATVTATDKYGTSLKFDVVVDVGNGLSALEPALAVRAMGCINCHTTVGSNIITDFGFGGDAKGRNYFLTGGDTSGGTAWNNGSIYGDHGNSYNSFEFDAARTLFMPPIPIPSFVQAVVPTTVARSTMADYVRWQFGRSPYAGTKVTTVQETQSMFIGAPTADQIRTSLKLGSGRLAYYKNDTTSPALGGLQDKGTYFKGTGTITCDGDVGLVGPLLLDHVTINTNNGCRLYVIGSVFINGPINYGPGANPNLQISSSRAITTGIGQLYKNGVICETSGINNGQGWYQNGSGGNVQSSLTERFKNIWTINTHVTRESGNAVALSAAVIADNDAITAGEGGFAVWDATCQPEGRNVAYEHLLLNAPYVHSRYWGKFDGTVIAEVALMSLNSFKFTFDPVFNEVPVLPFLDKSMFLDVH